MAMNTDEERITPNSNWTSDEPIIKWFDQSHHDPQDTSTGETEMSSEPFPMNDADSLTGFFVVDPFPIQGGLEKLDLMDTATTQNERAVAAVSTAIVTWENTAIPPASDFYEEIQALMYGMNKLKINHNSALEIARRYPLDPVMIAVQALLHRDDATAEAFWQKANQLGISSKVEQGCGLVQALVGRMLENGVGGVLQDSRRAEFWYNQAAKKGHAVAQCFLGLFHVKACEYDRALHWLEQAAKQGHARAQMHFGLLFEHGHVGTQGLRDYGKAKVWYQKASEQGDAKAACRLGFIVRKSNHSNDGLVDLEYLTVEELLMDSRMLEGEKRGEPSSIKMDGSIACEPLSVGVRVHKTFEHLSEGNDDVIAVKSQWQDTQGNSKKRRLENAVAIQERVDSDRGGPQPSRHEKSDASASFAGQCQNGVPGSLPADASTIHPYSMRRDFQIAGMDTDDAPDSDLQLNGTIEALLYGMNKTKVDQHAALNLARQHSSDPVMVCIQALLHRDDVAANALWKRANELGISTRVELGGGLVQALVGKMLENGVGGVRENLRRAEFWYNQAAKRGHATAQFFLGLFHVKDGEYDRARFWLEKAAKQGHARAQMHFGLLFEHSRDFETAKVWYKKAVGQGDAKAQCRLDFVEGKRRHDALDHADAASPIRDSQCKTVECAGTAANEGKMETSQVAGLAGGSASIDDSLRDSKRHRMHGQIGQNGSAHNAVSAVSAGNISFRQGTNGQLVRKDVSFAKMPGLSWGATGPLSQGRAFNQPGHLHPGKGVKCVAMVSPALAPDEIRPYCAVMGDKSTRGARLTTGTKVLREIKEWFRENRIAYQESGREALLYQEAMQRYFARMAELFADFPTDRAAREQTLLVKCTNKSLESNRVDKPNCFRYATDNVCQYGTAKLPQSILFYFDSRDPPKLDAEVTKYRRKLGTRPDLQGKRREYFESYLGFCTMTANQAADGCPTAQLAMESTNFIPALKKLWEDLEKA